MKPSNTNLKLHVIKHEIMTLLQQQNEGTKAHEHEARKAGMHRAGQGFGAIKLWLKSE